MLTCFRLAQSRPFVRNLLLSKQTTSSHVSQTERSTEVDSDVESTSTGLFSCPDWDGDSKLEMKEVAEKVLCVWHCCRWMLWGSDATASMASTPHMAPFPHSR